jgi:hypothetical protein
MGVTGDDLLNRILKTAGRKVDLVTYKDGIIDTTTTSNENKRQRTSARRPLRLGLDVGTLVALKTLCILWIMTSSLSASLSSLQLAQELQAPVAESTIGGEAEGIDFWAKHSSLLKDAWEEWESQQDLPPLVMDKMMDSSLKNTVQAAWKDPSLEHDVKELWTQVAPGVFSCQLFDANIIGDIRKHLDRACYESKIPIRRPNSMNRYGMILTEADGSVQLRRLDRFYQELVETYIRPIGRTLFSEYISSNKDDGETYAFTIRYKHGEDVALSEHSDASLYTLNVNLNLPHENYQGSSLYFVDESGAHHNVTMKPGMALLHRGMTRHASLPIEGEGERTNMIVWLFGDNGYVRIAPYEPQERLSRQQRWTKTKHPKHATDEL